MEQVAGDVDKNEVVEVGESADEAEGEENEGYTTKERRVDGQKCKEVTEVGDKSEDEAAAK